MAFQAGSDEEVCGEDHARMQSRRFLAEDLGHGLVENLDAGLPSFAVVRQARHRAHRRA